MRLSLHSCEISLLKEKYIVVSMQILKCNVSSDFIKPYASATNDAPLAILSCYWLLSLHLGPLLQTYQKP